MTAAARATAAALLALAPSLLGSGAPLYQGTARPLRGTLRATFAPPPAAPEWLKRAVCDRAAELGRDCGELARTVSEEAGVAGLDPVLVLAIIQVESAWDVEAVSSRDAHGLMQLERPTLADEFAAGGLASRDARDPLVNVRAGIRYYARMLERFRDPELAMVAYNAGPNRLAGYLRAEAGVPERLWEYPRRVRREERRLRARLAAPPDMVAAADPAPALH